MEQAIFSSALKRQKGNYCVAHHTMSQNSYKISKDY